MRLMMSLFTALALSCMVWSANAQNFSGQWTCSYISFDAGTQNRIERSYTLLLYPNGTYEAAGTHVSSLIGIYERWGSQGQWQIGGMSENTPYVQAGGTANFSSGRSEHFVFWGWIRGPNELASEYSQGGYQNRTSCGR
ncbi:MAG: hypothetical protein H6882_00395 [Rhodobiaceae bacterium]|nr:hypothetical protein [Rhodobiaceae bacterium]